MFKKIIICVALVSAILGILAVPATASATDYSYTSVPTYYAFDYKTNTTYVYEAKAVDPVDICAHMSLTDCERSPVGTVFYAYHQILGRAPDAPGFISWVGQNRGAHKLVQILLSTAEASPLLASDDVVFAGHMVVNAFGGYCDEGNYCSVSSWELDQAISNAASDLMTGNSQRSELAFDLMRFTKHLGTHSWDFQDHVTALAQGYDLGQYILVDTIEEDFDDSPYVPCDYYGYSPEVEDDCQVTSEDSNT